ncbi:TrbI/VirB10 family protein [Marinibaculum pumilum]|uniref:TrbI/VirB10 family protein n=1 Tax=Marinibaculum pumilum TaxID=1766165 RepID=A0ABV7L6Z5_9PROT
MSKGSSIGGALALGLVLLLAGCGDDEETPPEDVDAALSAELYEVPELPEPEPEPRIVQPPAPPPQPVIVMPAQPEPASKEVEKTPPPPPPERTLPPAPPPQFDLAAQRRAETAARRLSQRRQAGPGFGDVAAAAVAGTPAGAEWVNSDPDYRREDPPSTTSSFPVNRSFILTQDRVVTAVLQSPINSQIGGYVRAMVDMDVYGADGRYLLLEKGDVALGTYEALEKQGQSRLAVQWYRIIRARDGAHIYDDEDDQLGLAGDAMGRAGLVGDVDNRITERYGSAFVTAVVAAAAAAAVPPNSGNQNIAAAAQQFGQSAGQITAQALEATVDIAPVISVAAGERVVLTLNRDVYLRRPERVGEEVAAVTEPGRGEGR